MMKTGLTVIMTVAALAGGLFVGSRFGPERIVSRQVYVDSEPVYWAYSGGSYYDAGCILGLSELCAFGKIPGYGVEDVRQKIAISGIHLFYEPLPGTPSNLPDGLYIDGPHGEPILIAK